MTKKVVAAEADHAEQKISLSVSSALSQLSFGQKQRELEQEQESTLQAIKAHCRRAVVGHEGQLQRIEEELAQLVEKEVPDEEKVEVYQREREKLQKAVDAMNEEAEMRTITALQEAEHKLSELRQKYTVDEPALMEAEMGKSTAALAEIKQAAESQLDQICAEWEAKAPSAGGEALLERAKTDPNPRGPRRRSSLDDKGTLGSPKSSGRDRAASAETSGVDEDDEDDEDDMELPEELAGLAEDIEVLDIDTARSI